MIKLNMPEYGHKIKKINNELYIFDHIRRKYLLLTPEEWVRQNFSNYLQEELNYPKALMKHETGLKYDRKLKRSDILVYDREGKPFLLVECKSMKIKLSQDTLDQVAQYNYTIKAPFIVVTNGISMLCYEVDHQNKTLNKLESLPFFGD